MTIFQGDDEKKIEEAPKDTVFYREAKRFYEMDTDEVQQRLRRYDSSWEDTRQVRRVVPIQEAVRRVAPHNKRLAMLVRVRAVGIVEDDDGRLHPCRILDIMWGVDTVDMATKEIQRRFHPKLED